jgi:glycosyltransferase 2 family protein
MNRDRLTRWLYPTLGFCLLAFSLYILNRELARYNVHDILHSLALISDRQLVWAIGFAVLGCLVISSYDLIAFYWLKYPLNIQQILLTAFITYAVSNTTGFTLLIGGGIRYRFYSCWGVPAKYITRIIALGNLTFWLGLFALTGITFVINPLQLPEPLNLNSGIIRCLGIIALSFLGVYLYFCQSRKRLRISNRILSFPQSTISLAQIVIFSLDWASAAAILYCLIPDYPDKSYLNFFNIYLLAMATSIMSNVPGGLGVFETVIIFLLPSSLLAPDVLGSLLVYRAIHCLFPLAIALFLISYFEFKRKLEN